MKLLEVKMLQDAGYPLEPDDLTVAEWFDLAKIRQMLKPKTTCPLTIGKQQ